MSWTVALDVYGRRALGVRDVREAFESFGCWVRPLLDGTFDVGVDGLGFRLMDCPSPASRPGLVEWLARVRGVSAYTHLYGAEIEDVHSYVDDFDEADALWDDIRGAFALLAERIGGVFVFLDYDPAQPTDYYDEETGQTYRFPDEVDSAAEPEGPTPRTDEGAFLFLAWMGFPALTPHPMRRWMETCERLYPDLAPDRYGYEGRPITAAKRRYLFDPSSREYESLISNTELLGDVHVNLPAVYSPDRTTPVPLHRTYSIACRVPLDKLETGMGVEGLRDFFVRMARELPAELATCELGQRHWPVMSQDREFLGLPSVGSWWVWLGPDYARVVGGWLERGAPGSWVVEGTGDGGVFVQTAVEPVAYGAGAGQWFPEEFLPTVGPVPRRRLVDWLLGTRPRPQMGPARVMPTWTRPTTDTGPGADGTNGPDTRPAGGPEPTTDAGVGADAGRAHNPPTDPGADGTSGHVASADTDRAHNPTTGPRSAGGPGEPTED